MRKVDDTLGTLAGVLIEMKYLTKLRSFIELAIIFFEKGIYKLRVIINKKSTTKIRC